MSVNLSIKDVPDDIAQRLRERAARNHRSLQGELMAIVERAAREPAGTRAAAASSAPVLDPQARFGPGWVPGARTVEEIYAELRRRHPRPVDSGPLAVDIIRHDRDSR